MELHELGQRIHEISTSKGFIAPNSDNFPEKIALVHSELSEALEAHRKDLWDDKLPHRLGIEVELADAIIRILHIAYAMQLDIWGAVVEKVEYNATRKPLHGGKKY